MIKYGELIECAECGKVGCDDERATVYIGECINREQMLCIDCHGNYCVFFSIP